MRIQGRILRASDLCERRVLIALGIDPVLGLRVPRSHNPYAVARRIRRLARATMTDFSELRALLRRPKAPGGPTPDIDLPFPSPDVDGCPTGL